MRGIPAVFLVPWVASAFAPQWSVSARPMSTSLPAEFSTWTFDKANAKMSWNELSDATLQVQPWSGVEALESADLVLVGVAAPVKDDVDDEEESEDSSPTPVPLSGRAAEIDQAMSGGLSDILTESAKSFQAKAGTTTPILRVAGQSTKYAVVGLGGEKDAASMARSLGKALAEKANAKTIANVALVLPSDLSEADLSEMVATFYSTLYSDVRYKTKPKKTAEDLESVTIYSDTSADAILSGQKLAKGLFMTKDIVNAPHNVLNSESLAETAKRIAKESSLKCTVLGKKECEARGMGAFLGVARGSETEPQFIHLTYSPPGEVKKRVAVIGKGLLFDTGGYNIKTQMMELMKFDCGGAAAVLGAARAVGALAPEGVEVHFLVAACENMISGKAVVPSDILTASNGKTIEVMNTDAEGRLTLADALVYADKELGVDSIIELSTLTGACMVSLGKKICGVWTNDDDLAKELDEVSKQTGDSSWRMPMATEYNELLDSKFADMKNIGTRYGGAITAALFLQKFVSGKKPFAHIDIAGPVWDDKAGATGFGAKMVVEWVKRQGQ